MTDMVKSSVAAAGDVGAGLLRRVRRWLPGSDSAPEPEPRSRWRSVTIFRAEEEVMPGGQVPGPLAALGDLVEVQVRKAPGVKGTELRARLRTAEPSGAGAAVARATGKDPRQQVRAALREAKQLIEVGEVLRVDPAPHGQRSQAGPGRLIELATKRAPGEGVL